MTHLTAHRCNISQLHINNSELIRNSSLSQNYIFVASGGFSVLQTEAKERLFCLLNIVKLEMPVVLIQTSQTNKHPPRATVADSVSSCQKAPKPGRRWAKDVAHPGELLGVPQEHGPLPGDAVAVVEVHQLVQRREELLPHVVLSAAVLQHLEVLNVVPVTVKQAEEPSAEPSVCVSVCV